MGRRLRMLDKPTKATPAAVEVLKPHPLAWQVALKMAKGDTSRLQTVADGAVMVRRRCC